VNCPLGGLFKIFGVLRHNLYLSVLDVHDQEIEAYSIGRLINRGCDIGGWRVGLRDVSVVDLMLKLSL